MTQIPDPSIAPDDLPFALSLKRVNRGVGYVALFLPVWLILLTVFTNTCFNASISHYYFSRIGGDLFVGSLTFIGLLLTFFYSFRPHQVDGYRAHEWYDIWLIKLAGISAFLIAFSPTTGSGCTYNGAEVARAFLNHASGSQAFHPPGGTITGTISYDMWATFPVFGDAAHVPGILKALHFGGAAVMFSVLGYFSYFVFTRVNSLASLAAGSRKDRRNGWYKILGMAIFAAVGIMGGAAIIAKMVLSPEASEAFVTWWDGWRLTFVLETIALVSFGLSWMIKGRFIGAFEDQAALR
ncbi:hypothetical protein PEL8287_02937 [Roseovarius litorisediminis]|uniref:Uncharacterized protein n=1 Tax=Roseovarius litorisediminis TaxID=1312363 RepID=A0A1Y5T304_9RHOB|nr:hypothetical protein [Roseovarius litorisediminis]SLN54741.1 hypothetical protein PEL8287_02937 [Roseovarius litorisediminis]